MATNGYNGEKGAKLNQLSVLWATDCKNYNANA